MSLVAAARPKSVRTDIAGAAQLRDWREKAARGPVAAPYRAARIIAKTIAPPRTLACAVPARPLRRDLSRTFLLGRAPRGCAPPAR